MDKLTRVEIARLHRFLRAVWQEQPDEVASIMPEYADDFYSLLEKGTTFTAADVTARRKIRKNGKLYVIAQPHTMQENWLPEELPALYSPIPYRYGYREIGEYITAENPFSAGERGIDSDDVVWECTQDGCTYTPKQYGSYWRKVGKV